MQAVEARTFRIRKFLNADDAVEVMFAHNPCTDKSYMRHLDFGSSPEEQKTREGALMCDPTQIQRPRSSAMGQGAKTPLDVSHPQLKTPHARTFKRFIPTARQPDLTKALLPLN